MGTSGRASRPRIRRTAVAAAALLAFGLLTVVAAGGASSAQEAAPTSSLVDRDPRSAPSSTVAPAGGAIVPVQFNELVRLGLLMMESKPPTPPLVAAPPVVDPEPWTSPYRTGPRGESPVVTPPPALGPGDGTVYAVGDSVLLGTERWLGQVLGGWNLRLDARVSRRFPEGLDILRQNQASIGQVVVICLGHNYGGGGSSYGYIDDIMALTAKAQRVVFITQTEWSSPQVEVNRAIYAAAQRYPKIVVAPWAETIAANPEMLVDNVHPTSAGAVALANLVAIMVGPVSGISGSTPPPPKILPIPDDTRPAISIPSSTTTTKPGATTSTGATSTSTTSSSSSSTSTTAAPTSTSSSTTTSSSTPPTTP